VSKTRTNDDIFRRRRASALSRWHRLTAAAVLALPLAASGIIAWPTWAATSYAVTTTSPVAVGHCCGPAPTILPPIGA
jgi:hypothetical protein